VIDNARMSCDARRGRTGIPRTGWTALLIASLVVSACGDSTHDSVTPSTVTAGVTTSTVVHDDATRVALLATGRVVEVSMTTGDIVGPLATINGAAISADPNFGGSLSRDPNSGDVYFTTFGSGCRRDIVRLDRSGGQTVVVADASDPAISPDATKMASVRVKEFRGPGGAPGVPGCLAADVVVRDLASGKEDVWVQHTTGAFLIGGYRTEGWSEPRWSPDGTRLSVSAAAGESAGVFVFDGPVPAVDNDQLPFGENVAVVEKYAVDVESQFRRILGDQVDARESLHALSGIWLDRGTLVVNIASNAKVFHGVIDANRVVTQTFDPVRLGGKRLFLLATDGSNYLVRDLANPNSPTLSVLLAGANSAKPIAGDVRATTER
jgi:hypothetical protein